MAINKEKVCGWLVYYGSGEIGQYPQNVIELEVIPEVWELFVVKYPDYFDTSDDSEYCGFFAWKRELSFDEKIKRDTGYSLKPIQDLLNKFLVFEVWCLKNWNDFCAEYQRLAPEQIQTAKKFCVLDSVTTPAAPASGSFLVSPDPVPVVPADSALEAITAFIYDGITKEIKAPVRDSKRKTTLAEQEKTNAKLDSINEKIVLLEEKIELILQNTGRISREIIERIERKWNKGYRRYWQYEIQGLGYEEIWEWENPGRTLKGLNSVEKGEELNPIYSSICKAKEKGESKKGKR